MIPWEFVPSRTVTPVGLFGLGFPPSCLIHLCTRFHHIRTDRKGRLTRATSLSDLSTPLGHAGSSSQTSVPATTASLRATVTFHKQPNPATFFLTNPGSWVSRKWLARQPKFALDDSANVLAAGLRLR